MFEEVFFSATSHKKVSVAVVVAAAVSFSIQFCHDALFSRQVCKSSRMECYHLVSDMIQSWLYVIINMADWFEHQGDVI